MFDSMKKRNVYEQTRELEPAPARTQRNPVFRDSVIVDVTFFETKTPDDPLGYLCGGIIQVFSDGGIIIYSQDEKSILEKINLKDIIRGRDKINNNDPEFGTMVSLMTFEKAVHISFERIEMKNAFWSAITSVYDSLKIDSDGMNEMTQTSTGEV